MQMCKYACYRLKEGLGFSKRVCTFEQLTSKYSIQTIKEFLKTKAIVINYCGKCDYCLGVKINNYKKRVQSQLKKSKFNYLITLTFSNDNINTLITEEQRDTLLNNDISISPLSNLSKTVISNIIRNWKKKLNKYYGNIDFHYFLCGEYGENTNRAHYHVLLMLDQPIPHLVKQPVKGNHFKSSIIDSSQYDLYDIEPADSSTNTAKYISKYLGKSKDWDKGNYNRFHQEQIDELLDMGINPEGLVIPNKKEDVKYILLWWVLQGEQLDLFSKKFNWNKIKCREVHQQRPFIKCSRGLGMSSDEMENFKNGVINGYYIDKYKTEYERRPTPYLEKVLKLYNQQRLNNIQKYFYKNTTDKKKTNTNDIF